MIKMIKIISLKPSTDLTIQSESTQASFKTSGDKYRYQYKKQLQQKTKEDQSLDKCILCHIFEDTSIQKEGGLLVRKLANFTNDSVIFSMKPLQEAKVDIQRLAQAFKKEPAFKFNTNEMTYWEGIYAILQPKAKAKRHMDESLNYLKQHICQAASSQKPTKVKDFEFNFNWQCEDFQVDSKIRATRHKRNLSEVQWNFSNLDRNDRIHMVYTTL